MKVFLLHDVPSLGKKGMIITVTTGYARNYLFPRKLAKEVQENMVEHYAALSKKTGAAFEAADLPERAEKITEAKITLAKRVHDDGRLYASVSAQEIIDALKEHGIAVSKKQVEFDKTIKTIGEHSVTIRLSQKHQPAVRLKVVAQQS